MCSISYQPVSPPLPQELQDGLTMGDLREEGDDHVAYSSPYSIQSPKLSVQHYTTELLVRSRK